jgi:6-phosphogluconolactonase
MMHEFLSREVLARALADDVAAVLVACLAREGGAALALSGGSTPILFLHALSRKTLDWARVAVTLVDDRWVPETSPRSNAALLRAHLLQGPAAAARFLPLMNGAATPEAGRAAVAAELATLGLPLAAAVLGMGLDGHTASFFPGGDNLAAALSLTSGELVQTIRAPGADEPRITLTLPVLLEATFLAVHIEGAAKRQTLERALTPGPMEAMPIRAVLAHDPKIYWSP